MSRKVVEDASAVANSKPSNLEIASSDLYEILRKAPTSNTSSDLSLEKEERKAHIDDRKTDTALKKKYANNFFWLLVAQLVVMNGVLIAVGFEKLNYTDVTLNLYMGGTLAEVFGIVLVITRYLFSKKYQ